VKTYGQFCPLAMALEVVGERWTLLVVRELLCGSRRFNDLARGVPQMSRTMLSQRLKTLEDAGLVVRLPAVIAGSHEYCLTQAGEDLRPIAMGLGDWGKRWASKDVREEHLDASLLMWDIHRRINNEALPPGRIVLLFEFSDGPTGRQRFWLRLEGEQTDVCFTDPGFEVQAVLQCSVRTLTEVWMGTQKLGEAVRSGALTINGKTPIVRQIPHWLKLSMFA
jgi:DNA-binding HxlR family transcriptional regulator